MANEAVLLVQTHLPQNFTVDNATGIAKGALCAMSDPNTAAAANTGAHAAGASQAIAGIAASEKIASDGITKLGMYRQGVFKMTCSGAIAFGNAVSSASGAGYANTIMVAPVTASGSAIIGQALETGADTETIRVQVDVGAGGAQIS